MPPTQEQLQALVRVWDFAERHDCGGARVLGKLLLGLYNGRRFPFDLTSLRGLDRQNFLDAMALLVMDWQPCAEVHEVLQQVTGRPRMGARFEHLAYRLGMPRRCKKADLPPLSAPAEQVTS